VNGCRKEDMQHELAMVTVAAFALYWIFLVFAK
jgi:hypothetical protein